MLGCGAAHSWAGGVRTSLRLALKLQDLLDTSYIFVMRQELIEGPLYSGDCMCSSFQYIASPNAEAASIWVNFCLAPHSDFQLC